MAGVHLVKLAGVGFKVAGCAETAQAGEGIHGRGGMGVAVPLRGGQEEGGFVLRDEVEDYDRCVVHASHVAADGGHEAGDCGGRGLAAHHGDGLCEGEDVPEAIGGGNQPAAERRKEDLWEGR